MDHPTITARIKALQIDSPRQWGQMRIEQMLAHCSQQIRVCTGQAPSRRRGSRWFQAIIRWFSLNLPIRLPKNIKTVAELDPNKKLPPAGTFEVEKATLLSLFQHLHDLPPQHHFEHPVFGLMSKKQCIHLTQVHLDHHLRQFGV
jgi:Protein of unknown function (DUF1569)